MRAVRTNPKPNARVYYKIVDIHALAEGSAETRATPGGERCFEGAPTGASIKPSIAPSQEQARKNPSDALLERIATALANRADNAGYPLFRDPLGVLVRKALADESYDLSDRKFKIAVWNRVDRTGNRKGGRRTRGDRAKFNVDASQLQKIVQKLARDWTLARCRPAANDDLEAVNQNGGGCN